MHTIFGHFDLDQSSNLNFANRSHRDLFAKVQKNIASLKIGVPAIKWEFKTANQHLVRANIKLQV